VRGAWNKSLRLPRHPALTWAGNLWFVIGAATLVAGLIGGFLSLVNGFPLVFLILSVIGGFLVTFGGLRAYLPKPKLTDQDRAWAEEAKLAEERRQQDERELRKSLQFVRGELVRDRDAVERASDARTLDPTQELPSERWANRYEALAEEPGLTPVYQAAEWAYQALADVRAVGKDETLRRADRAIAALEEAIDRLEPSS
jgi:hypothetical protein